MVYQVIGKLVSLVAGINMLVIYLYGLYSILPGQYDIIVISLGTFVPRNQAAH
jgi:hypothetical protein